MIREAIDAVEKAPKAASRKLSSHLRRSAAESGWDQSAAATLRVKSEDGSMWVEGSEAAANEEYGNIDVRPKPAVRQFANRQEMLDAEILKQAERILKGKL